MDDINTMWVWIPRFSATGDTENYNGGTIDNPGAFNITFVDEETSAHDAFTFGNDSLTGFWMGKFEITGDVSNECTNEFCDISDVTILPNNYSLVNKIVSNYFYIGRNMEKSGNQYGFDKTIDTTLDTHMIKNSEWGAVVYLTQSIYGRCTSPTSCSEVEVNSYGSGAGMPEPTSNISEINNYNASFLAVSDSCDKSKNVTGECDYEGNLNQSTTGNIYGVYDMSGGAEEYVMGMLSMDSPKDYSGFSSSTSTSSFDLLPEEKYYNYYNKESLIELQHATDETENWYVDFYGYYSGFFWYLRGYRYFNISSAGIFAYSFSDGQGRSYIGSRLIIAN